MCFLSAKEVQYQFFWLIVQKECVFLMVQLRQEINYLTTVLLNATFTAIRHSLWLMQKVTTVSFYKIPVMFYYLGIFTVFILCITFKLVYFTLTVFCDCVCVYICRLRIYANHYLWIRLEATISEAHRGKKSVYTIVSLAGIMYLYCIFK